MGYKGVPDHYKDVTENSVYPKMALLIGNMMLNHQTLGLPDFQTNTNRLWGIIEIKFPILKKRNWLSIKSAIYHGYYWLMGFSWLMGC